MNVCVCVCVCVCVSASATQLEDFDPFAADVAARHVGHVPDSMLVTAVMERLTWHLHPQHHHHHMQQRQQQQKQEEQEQSGRAGEWAGAAGAYGGRGSGRGAGGGGGGGGSWRLPPVAPTDMRLSGQVKRRAGGDAGWGGDRCSRQKTHLDAPGRVPVLYLCAVELPRSAHRQ